MRAKVFEVYICIFERVDGKSKIVVRISELWEMLGQKKEVSITTLLH